jgi:hypothetical protein
MLDLAVNGYNKADIIKQLHAKNGVRQIKFRYNLLNKYEIKIGEISTLSEGNSINFESLAEIKRTANFVIKESDTNNIDWLNDRLQPVFCLKMPDGGYAKWNLGVFMLSSPSRKQDYNSIWREIEAYDTSLILQDDKFLNRYVIAQGTNYINAIKTIINGAGISKVNIPASDSEIGADKEFEAGQTKLSAINSLLAEINYTSLWVDENGYFTSKSYIIPTQRETDYTYKTDDLSVVHNGAIENLDIFNVPNTWVVTASNPEKLPLVSTYINNLPTSTTSTINRGRTIVKYAKTDDIADQTTLDAYTKRLAYNDSQVYGRFTFDTTCMPHHSFLDIINIDHNILNVSAKFTETSWNIELQAGGKMSHNLRRVINI